MTANLFTCAVTLAKYRASPVETITADDGTVLTVPAATAYQTGKLADLFNQCNRTTPAKLAVVKLDNVPVVEIDPDGEVITGYIIADNYFELYVNGRLIGVDPVPYTPFNSVRSALQSEAALLVCAESRGLGGAARPGHGDQSRQRLACR